MFKTIEYKLILYIVFLIASVAFSTYLFLNKEYVYASATLLCAFFCLYKLYQHYRKFNQNILFLLNALDNGDYSFHFSETRLSSREKELNQMLNRIKDILIKARKDIIENENFLSLIIESVSTGIIILDQNNNVQSVNKATLQLLGLNVFTHLDQLKYIDKSYSHLFRDLEPGKTQQIKLTNEREESQISLKSSLITMKRGEIKIITLNNIGNELEAKEMESWIRLIRVMTHEIMNSIAPITSLSEAMLSYYQEDSDDENLQETTIEALEVINTTAKGLTTFVESYRQFSGIPKPKLAKVDLIALLDKIIQLQSYHIKEKNINIDFKHSMPRVDVSIDETQITQVLVNLIKNAIEAIEVGQSGIIQVRVSSYDNKVQIDIANNGTPIPEDVASHIFIPFFTTKESGTGIGLSVSRYIMRLHGGNLKYHTSDSWTTFSMVL